MRKFLLILLFAYANLFSQTLRSDYKYVVVCAGNSLTNGGCDFNLAMENYPALLSHNINIARVYNAGHGGLTTTGLIALFDTEVKPHYDSNKTNVFVAWEMRNDLASGASRDSAEARYKRYCLQGKGAGFKVVAMTVLTGVSTNSDRDSVNNWLRNHYNEFADKLCDVDTMTIFSNPLNILIYCDGTHLTVLGNYYLEAAVYNVITSIPTGAGSGQGLYGTSDSLEIIKELQIYQARYDQILKQINELTIAKYQLEGILIYLNNKLKQ